MGRSYAWEGKNDSASIYLERAIIASPEYIDGYSAYLDNLSWAEQYACADIVLAKAKDNLVRHFQMNCDTKNQGYFITRKSIQKHIR